MRRLKLCYVPETLGINCESNLIKTANLIKNIKRCGNKRRIITSLFAQKHESTECKNYCIFNFYTCIYRQFYN